MKKLIFIVPVLFFIKLNAQQFITTGVIEYEARTNQHKIIEGYEWLQGVKDQIPQFSTSYYLLNFNKTQSVYKYSRTTDTRRGFMFFGGREDDKVWFNDYAAKKYTDVVTIDDNYLVSGDLKKIKWKLYPSDQRIIAGFNCRRASTILFDSVYVFAYYTEEIPVPGGPMGLNGLPGMILGVTVPRLFTSWVATYVKLDAPKDIQPPVKGKKKTTEEIYKSLRDLSKSWGKNGEKFLSPLIWRTFL
ncbi:hypothetical protein A8C56_04605 [Niabella ginsenosidivorans]|uniref:GLPGLI family protein n=1 Tax=Niabella ginsenosidivorans TaxID=1176587 RepID=A0A1A9HZ52_9BACT|nr:GLPGLI family protein [Niabella ginsenosidivorans]ANH80355.1 hypothetical protein A8C56_04605 [Niabella ginsenosidivorans]